MSDLYAIYKNDEIMLNANKDPMVLEDKPLVDLLKRSLEVIARAMNSSDTFEIMVLVPQPDVQKSYKPEDFKAGLAEVSNEGYIYACKHFGMNPMQINKVRSSEQWAEIVELAKKHDIGVYKIEDPTNPCEYINTPERPWNVKIDPDNECNLTPVPGVKPQLSEHEHAEKEVEEALGEKLRNKIERTASKVPTKEVWGIYSRDDKPETSEFHRDGQHVLFLTQKMANDYVNRIANFVEFGVFSRKKMVPVTTKVIGDGLS